MSEKIDSLLNADVEKLINEAGKQVSEVDEKMVQKYKERSDIAEKVSKDLKAARSMPNKDWAQALLKNSAEKLVIAQEIFTHEIKDIPAAKNITSASELANALNATVVSVVELDREEVRMALSKEKNELRRMEVEALNGLQPTINVNGSKVVGIGSNDDILRLMKSGLDPSKLIGEDKNAPASSK
jgi:CBS domain-containing protein